MFCLKEYFGVSFAYLPSSECLAECIPGEEASASGAAARWWQKCQCSPLPSWPDCNLHSQSWLLKCILRVLMISLIPSSSAKQAVQAKLSAHKNPEEVALPRFLRKGMLLAQSSYMYTIPGEWIFLLWLIRSSENNFHHANWQAGVLSCRRNYYSNLCL